MNDRLTLGQLILTLLVTLSGAKAWAANWFLPAHDENREVWVANQSSEPLNLWLSPPDHGDGLGGEKSFTLEAGDMQKLPTELFNEAPFLVVKSREPRALQVLIKQPGGWEIVPEGRSSQRQGSLAGDQAVFVTNVSPIRQDGLIQVRSPQGGLTHTFSLKGFETAKLTLPEGSTFVSVSGELNLLAWTWTPEKIKTLKPTAEKTASARTVRFLLSNETREFSFVVEMTDPEMIRQAREQLRFPDDYRPRILIADIEAGSQGNQDLLNPLRGSWSWHVKPVTFAGFAPQACDGNPELVENFLLTKLSAPTICFWHYRIIDELSPTRELAP